MTGHKLVSHYPTSAWRLSQYVYDRTFSASMRHTSAVMILAVVLEMAVEVAGDQLILNLSFVC